jgi:hypothetical protein
MHTRLCDLARASTCAAYAEPRDDDLRAARGIVWATVGSVVFWVIVGLAVT